MTETIIQAAAALWLAFLSTIFINVRPASVLTPRVVTIVLAVVLGFHAYARFMGWPS